MEPLYQYKCPTELIAKEPMRPRDHSRLLVYHSGSDTISFDRFYNLPKHLPKDSFLVMNETKVLPARLKARRENGDDVDLLIFPSEVDFSAQKVKASANKRLRNGQKIFLTPEHTLEVIEETEKAFTFKAHFDLAHLPKLLLKHGETPLPQYIQSSNLSEKDLRKKYQTVFAKNPGAAAAPTASLHFTNRVFKHLDRAGIERHFLTLHVGLGTFAPVLPEHFKSRSLYEECYEIEPERVWEIENAKIGGKSCTAVGTTTVRTLESFARSRANQDKTKLFIFSPFEFQMVDQLLTNFHLPGSSLMMLVEAFLQHKGAKRPLKKIYEIAIQEKFRFYSFGDCMLIL